MHSKNVLELCDSSVKRIITNFTQVTTRLVKFITRFSSVRHFTGTPFQLCKKTTLLTFEEAPSYWFEILIVFHQVINKLLNEFRAIQMTEPIEDYQNTRANDRT